MNKTKAGHNSTLHCIKEEKAERDRKGKERKGIRTEKAEQHSAETLKQETSATLVEIIIICSLIAVFMLSN